MQVIANSYTRTNAKSNANTYVYTNTKAIANANAYVIANANADVNAEKTHRQKQMQM